MPQAAQRPMPPVLAMRLGMLALAAAVAWAVFVTHVRVVAELRFLPASWQGAMGEVHVFAWTGSVASAKDATLDGFGLPEALTLSPWPQAQPRIPLRVPPRAMALVKHLEARKLHAYRDLAGVLTIGYGHTGHVGAHEAITPRAADMLLAGDLEAAAAQVRRRVRVPLNLNEFSALVSLVFNIGADAFAHSDGLALLNDGRRRAAMVAFLAFDKAKVRGQLAMLSGLLKRRRMEQALFLREPSDSENGRMVLAGEAIALPPAPIRNAPTRAAGAAAPMELPLAPILGARDRRPVPAPQPDQPYAVAMNRGWPLA